MAAILAIRWVILPADSIGRYIAAVLVLEAILLTIGIIGILARGPTS